VNTVAEQEAIKSENLRQIKQETQEFLRQYERHSGSQSATVPHEHYQSGGGLTTAFYMPPVVSRGSPLSACKFDL
jgi:hypothetical protein